MRNIWALVLVTALLLTGCASGSAGSEPADGSNESSLSSSADDTSSVPEPAKPGSDRWFLDEFIADLELLLGLEPFDAEKSPREDKLLLFAYMKLEYQGAVGDYFDDSEEAFILPYALVDGVIRRYFGSVDLRALDNFDEDSQTFSLGIQSFGSMTVPEVVKRTIMSDERIKLTIDNINPDLPDDHKVVKRRDYVFLETKDSYVLESAELIFYNPPPPSD